MDAAFAEISRINNPNIKDIILDGTLIKRGLEIPSHYRGDKYTIRPDSDSLRWVDLKDGDDREIEVWKLTDLVPIGTILRTFSEDTLRPRTYLEMNTVNGAKSDGVVVRNSKGQLFLFDLRKHLDLIAVKSI